MRRWIVAFVAVTALSCIAAVTTDAQTPDLQQHFRTQYEGRIFLLRGFYSTDRLHYDSKGTPIGNAPSGDWTMDGFVRLNQVELTNSALRINATRLVAVAEEKGFRLLPSSVKGRKKKEHDLGIEAEIDTASISVERLDGLLSRIFLNAQDNLVEHVPEYWSDCVSSGSGRCNFSLEILSVPGIASALHSQVPRTTNTQVSNGAVMKNGDGIKPPMPVSHPDPSFNDDARKAGVTGLVTLGTTVDNTGHPTNIKVLSPLGYGLDAEAVRTLATWKFKPAMKDGQPVAVKIAIEMDFHLYY